MTKKLMAALVALLMCACMFVCVSAAPAENDHLLLQDAADLLSEDEEAALFAELAAVSETYGAQVAVCTVPSLGNTDVSVDALVENVYDTLGYGYGENHDGVLLLVCMDPREYRILSNGFAAEAITMDDIESISDWIVSDLSDGEYAAAFDTYVNECEYYLDGYINGFPFSVVSNLIIALVVGVIVGGIVALVLRGQLKSVRRQDKANSYVKTGSMNLTQSNDFFLYRTVTRTAKPKNTSSSSSSGSGSSRNVGGGSF